MFNLSTKTRAVRQVVGAAAVALSAATFTGCKENEGLESAQSLQAKGDRIPAFMKLADSSLLCIIQKNEDVYFFKNAPGYGEAGKGIHLQIASGSHDYSTAGLYTEISPLAALAYVQNDWEVIVRAVEAQAREVPHSVDPRAVENTLKPLAVPRIHYGSDGKVQFERTRPGRSLGMVEAGKEYMDGCFFSVFILLPDGGMLAVCEDRIGVDLEGGARWITSSQTEIRFFRNWPEYSVEGRGASVLGVGLSREYTVLGRAHELTPQEVLAYFDGKWEPIYEAVRRQYFIVEATPHPDAVKNALLGGPSYQGTSASLPPPEFTWLIPIE